MNADDYWKTLAIPGEFDAMDATDQGRWRGVIEQAYALGRRAGMTEAAGICGQYASIELIAEKCAAAIEKARDAK